MNQLSGFLVLALVCLGLFRWYEFWKSSRALPFDTRTLETTEPTRDRTVPTSVWALGLGYLVLQMISMILSIQTTPPEEFTLPSPETLFGSSIILPASITAILAAIWAISPDGIALKNLLRTRNFKQDIIAGFELFLLAFPPTLLLLIISLQWKTVDNQHPLLRMIKESGNEQVVAIIVVAATIVAPLFEELLFRFVLLHGAANQSTRKPPALGPGSVWLIGIVAILFCLGHGVYDALQLLPLSLCLTISSWRRQSYWTVVTTHACFNGFMLIMMFLGES